MEKRPWARCSSLIGLFGSLTVRLPIVQRMQFFGFTSRRKMKHKILQRLRGTRGATYHDAFKMPIGFLDEE